MRNVRRLSPVTVNVCRLATYIPGAERFFIGALNAQHRPANNLSPRSYTRGKGWRRPFDDPIERPNGRKLITLEDAGNYITKLPKVEHTAPEWQAAVQALMLVATLGGPTMFVRIGVMRAINRHSRR
jgi:hypothetical protein